MKKIEDIQNLPNDFISGHKDLVNFSEIVQDTEKKLSSELNAGVKQSEYENLNKMYEAAQQANKLLDHISRLRGR